MRKNKQRSWMRSTRVVFLSVLFILGDLLSLPNAYSDDTGFPTEAFLRQCSTFRRLTLQSWAISPKQDPKARLLSFNGQNANRPYVISQGELWRVPEGPGLSPERLFAGLPTEVLGSVSVEGDTFKIISQESRGFRVTHLDPKKKVVLSSTSFVLDTCSSCSESIREPAMLFRATYGYSRAGDYQPIWFLGGKSHVWSFDPKSGAAPVREFSLTPAMIESGEEIVGFSEKLGYETDGDRYFETKAITTAKKGKTQYRLDELQTRIAYSSTTTFTFTGLSEPARGWAMVGSRAFSNGLLAKREALSDPQPDPQDREASVDPSLRKSPAQLVEGRCSKEGEKWFLDPKASYQSTLFFPFTFFPQVFAREKLYLNSEPGQSVFDLTFASNPLSSANPNAVLVVAQGNEESRPSWACSLGRGVVDIFWQWWSSRDAFLLQSSEKEGLTLRQIHFER